MSRILIVDDELPIRQWLSASCAELPGQDSEQIRTAPNGMIALNYLKESPADIIFVDIKMPGMNGLELVRRIRETDEEIYIVVLSSLDDFHFVRDAFENKANDYVLKTEITAAYLERILDKAAEWSSSLSARKHDYRTIEDMELFCENLSAAEDADAFLQPYAMTLPAGFWFCVAAFGKEGVEREIKISHVKDLHRIFTVTCDGAVLFCLEILGEGSLLLQYQKVLNYMKKISTMNTDYYLSCGDIQTKQAELGRELKWVYQGLAYRFYSEDAVFSLAGKSRQEEKEKERVITEKYLDVVNAMRASDEGQIRECLNALFRYIRESWCLNVDLIRILSSKLCELFFEKGEEGALSQILAHQQELFRKIADAKKIGVLQEIVLAEYERFVQRQSKKQRYSALIRKAVAYIEEHYPTISGIQEVADEVCLNAEYFSRTFKKETGQNFSVFLNDYRLEQSVALLKNPSSRIYEIAEQVGFTSLGYYSKKFKEKYGISPYRYKDVTE